MKKLTALIVFIILVLTGCVAKDITSPVGGDSGSPNSNAILEGVVKKINLEYGNVTSLLLLDDKNSHWVFDIDGKVDFKEAKKLNTGDRIRVEHTGEVRKSYPVQGTAKKISILESNTSAVIDGKLYTVHPIGAGYDDAIFEKTNNPLGIFHEVIDSKEKFEDYLNQLNFGSENKVDFKAKYDSTFFEKQKLILILKHTSSTPSYSIGSITQMNEKLHIKIKEKTSEQQTTDILIKGFLIEIGINVMQDIKTVDMEYIREIVKR
jgi:hypothetical protein